VARVAVGEQESERPSSTWRVDGPARAAAGGGAAALLVVADGSEASLRDVAGSSRSSAYRRAVAVDLLTCRRP